MKKNKAKIIFQELIVLFAVILLVLSVIFISVQSKKTKIKEDYTPTLVLHGSPTTRNSMLPMIERMSRAINGQHDLTLVVDNHGRVHAEGKYQVLPNSIIQIIFENNDSSEYNQVQWLGNCMRYLKKKCGIKEVNFIGHSLGGVDMLFYLSEYEPKIRQQVPRVNKVVTLGSPFNGENKEDNADYKQIEKIGPEKMLKTYKLMVKNAEKYPLAVNEWLNIAGDRYDNGHGDGIVPIGSVASLSPIMEKQHIDYQFTIIPYVSHSGLHASQRVDRVIEEFIWGNNRKKT